MERARSRWERVGLERVPGVMLAPDAQIDAGRVTLHHGCRLTVGARSIVEATLDLERDGAELVVGENCYLGASTFKCAERIEVGDDVELAWNCTVVDHDWESLVFEQRRVDMRQWYRAEKQWDHVAIAPVRIGRRALIGFNAVILKGVQIGEGAVVGVNSVVTRDVPAYAVVAGAPARVIRQLNPAAVRQPAQLAEAGL